MYTVQSIPVLPRLINRFTVTPQFLTPSSFPRPSADYSQRYSDDFGNFLKRLAFAYTVPPCSPITALHLPSSLTIVNMIFFIKTNNLLELIAYIKPTTFGGGGGGGIGF